MTRPALREFGSHLAPAQLADSLAIQTAAKSGFVYLVKDPQTRFSQYLETCQY